MTLGLILAGLAFMAFLLVSLIANIRHNRAKKLDRMYRRQMGIELNEASSDYDIGGGFDGGGDL